MVLHKSKIILLLVSNILEFNLYLIISNEVIQNISLTLYIDYY